MKTSREWKVVTAEHPTLLEHKLQELSDSKWTIFDVLTEGSRDGFCFTVIAYMVVA